MQTRTLTAIGCATGSAAIVLLAVLMAVAFTADMTANPRFSVFCVADILLGVTAASSLVVAITRADKAEYIRGVGETVDRLAAALPDSKPRLQRVS